MSSERTHEAACSVAVMKQGYSRSRFGVRWTAGFCFPRCKSVNGYKTISSDKRPCTPQLHFFFFFLFEWTRSNIPKALRRCLQTYQESGDFSLRFPPSNAVRFGSAPDSDFGEQRKNPDLHWQRKSATKPLLTSKKPSLIGDQTIHENETDPVQPISSPSAEVRKSRPTSTTE